ncbi:MAG: hypothetical protein EXS03_03325 [Phycisphaerales bacterium]|nr:hypothetical protein [Phycisphaerales bacterium]
MDEPVRLLGANGLSTMRGVADGSITGTAALGSLSKAFSDSTNELLGALSGPTPATGAKHTKPAPRSSRTAKAAKQREFSLRLRESFDRVVPDAAAWQLCRLVTSAVPAEQGAVAGEFLAHPEFARTLALVAEPDAEEAAKVVRIARALMAQRSEAVERFPELAAAVSVVLDVPVVMAVNENVARGCDPIVVFDHFVASEWRMFFGLRGIAPELLIYLVDVAATPDELAWALSQFAGHPAVGELYDKVEYDFDHLEKGQPKKVNEAGWNLRNILKFGGICADQAYFATTVGKAIGVPCAYTAATDGVLSHAWIGFVAKSGRHPQWTETGRFGAYQGVEGLTRDPQTQRQVSNTQMPMLVQYGIEPSGDRAYAAALRIAARKLCGDPKAKTPPAPQAIAQALELAGLAVRACITDPRSWSVVALAAQSGAMTTEQKQLWATDIVDLCGESYPEYALRTIAPMIESITDPGERHQALDGAFKLFQSRGDLAGQILMQQAALFEAETNLAAAGRCYETVLERYPNDGPFAISALKAASAILGTTNNVMANVTLHDRAFRSMEVPEGISPQFARQSNWFRSGVMLAAALRLAGRDRDALLLEQRMATQMR